MHTKTIEYYLGILLMLSSPIQYDVMTQENSISRFQEAILITAKRFTG